MPEFAFIEKLSGCEDRFYQTVMALVNPFTPAV
jgi:hypothetical protein